MKKILLGVLVSFAGQAYAAPTLQDFEVRSSYENWKLPGNETMGMTSIGLSHRVDRYFNVGVESYGAVRGERGGFITLGVTGGVEYPLSDRVDLESGLSVGGGGGRGGYLLSGGGLMVRENIGMRYRTSSFGNLSVGFSNVDFPNNGTIHSRQIYVAYSLPFQNLMEPGLFAADERTISASDFDAYKPSMHEISLVAKQINVGSNTLNDAGAAQKDFGLMGVEWRTYLDKHWFARIESAAAMQGDSRGYMHILAGGGVQYPLVGGLSANASLAFGPGGGGGVATGGGLLMDAEAGLQYALSKNWFADISVSRFSAPSTNFVSRSVGARLGYRFGTSWRDGERDDADSALRPHPIRVRMVDQQYFGAAADGRSRPEQGVGNLGMQLDYFLSPQFFFTGQGLGAYSGDAGAYMTGLVGAGVRHQVGRRAHVELEGLIGPAGGGGLNTGSGLVYQANLGLGFDLTKSLSLMGTVGRMNAVNGHLRANVVGISLAYEFRIFNSGH